MANTVYKVEEYELQDGSLVTLRPAVIAVQRKGQEMINKLGEAETEDEGVKRLLDIVCLCLKRQRPEFQKEEETENEDGTKSTKKVTNYEVMEEIFDFDTIFKVIEVYLGIKLNDPKLLAAMMEMAANTENEDKESDSKTSTSQNSKKKPSRSASGTASNTLKSA